MVQSTIVYQRMVSNQESNAVLTKTNALLRQISTSDGSFIQNFDSSVVFEPLLDELVSQCEKDTRKKKPYALHLFGLLHQRGVCGFVKDGTKAAEFFHEASQANYSPASYELQKLFTSKSSPETESLPTFLVHESEEKAIEMRIQKLLQGIAQGHGDSEVELEELCKQETTCKILKAVRGQLESEITDGQIVLDDYLSDKMLKLGYLIIAANTSENKESYREAFGLISLSRSLKNTGAMFYLSALYRLGLGVEKSSVEASKCLQEAAKYGNLYAMASLVGESIDCTVGGEELHLKGLQYARELSRVGSSEGYYNLGLCFLHGLAGLKPDINNALRYFKQAAVGIEYQQNQHSNAEALFALGIVFESGITGLLRDYNKARDFYTVSIKEGNPKACIQLAKMYEKGRGVEQDLDKALFLLMKVLKLGQIHLLEGSQGRQFDPHLVACVSAYGSYRHGRVLEKSGNKMKSELAYRAAAKALEFLSAHAYKSCAILYLLGKLSQRGRGRTVCLESARKFYKESCDEAKKTYDILQKEFSKKAEEKLKEIEQILAKRDSSFDLTDLSDRLKQHQIVEPDHLRLPKLVKRPIVSRVESFTSVDEREIDDILNSIDKLPGFQDTKPDHTEAILEEATTADRDNESPSDNPEASQPSIAVQSEGNESRRDSSECDLESNVTVEETLSEHSSGAVSSVWSADSRPNTEGGSRAKTAGNSVAEINGTESDGYKEGPKETEDAIKPYEVIEAAREIIGTRNNSHAANPAQRNAESFNKTPKVQPEVGINDIVKSSKTSEPFESPQNNNYSTLSKPADIQTTPGHETVDNERINDKENSESKRQSKQGVNGVSGSQANGLNSVQGKKETKAKSSKSKVCVIL